MSYKPNQVASQVRGEIDDMCSETIRSPILTQSDHHYLGLIAPNCKECPGHRETL
jgi:hypothetical protein